jgi:predicted HTH domain antitoxin
MSVQLTIDLPEDVFPILRTHPDTFVKEMRLAAAIKWFEIGQISQAKAAELAGISRQQFINNLSRFQVSPIQMTPEELAAEFSADEQILDR